ncbi:MAG: OsmC family protein [Planctomycetota bacterium]|nr:OsmC family protein [Planctomycetota bacterium]
MKTMQRTLNGLDLTRLQGLVDDIKRDPASGMAKFCVRTNWTGGASTESTVSHWELGGRREARRFTVRTDEPPALMGAGEEANPQEVLMAGLNACMMVGYAALCAIEGIELESIEIETEGTLDLRGFLALDKNVKPGYDDLKYTVRIKGDGTPEQFERVHKGVQATSPNFFNLAHAVGLRPTLVVE